MTSTRPAPLRTHRLVRPLALAALLSLLAGCALSPPKPPMCEGPWTPINGAPAAQAVR